jgi:hypothetical protein
MEIAFLSGDQAGVVSQSGRKGIVNISKSGMRLALPSDDAYILDSETENTDIEPSESTFAAHPNTDWQAQGSHLAIYSNGMDSRFIDAIPELLSSAIALPADPESNSLPLGFGSFAQGIYFASRMIGTEDDMSPPEMLSIIAVEEQDGQRRSVFASLFPYWQNKSRYAFKLDQVLVWQEGLEANLVGSIDGSDVSFFDCRYLHNRHLYHAEQTFTVMLAAHAYRMTPDESPTEMTINRQADQAAAMAWLNETSLEKELTMTINMANMMLGSMVHDGEDDYQFRGQVVAISERHFLGVACYECQIQIHYDATPMSMMVPLSAWEGDEPPTLGQQVTGSFWLTGEIVRDNISHLN